MYIMYMAVLVQRKVEWALCSGFVKHALWLLHKLVLEINSEEMAYMNRFVASRLYTKALSMTLLDRKAFWRKSHISHH